MPKAPQKLSEQVIKRAQQDVSERLGFEVNREIIVASQEDPPKIPPFPTLVVMLNALADVLSIAGDVADLTGVGWFISGALDAIVLIINFVWFLTHGGKLKKEAAKLAVKTLIWIIAGIILTDAVPFNDIIVPNSLVIILLHYRQKKIIKGILYAFQQFNEVELPKQIRQALRDSDVVSSNVVRRARNPRPSN